MRNEIEFRPDGPFKKGHLVPERWRQSVSKAQKGVKRSKRFKRKRSAYMKKHWREAQYRIFTKSYYEELSQKFKGRVFSDETRKRMSENQWVKRLIQQGHPHPFKGQTRLSLRGKNNPAKREEVRAKISRGKRELYKEHPELHLNRILARKGAVSRGQRTLLVIVRKTYPDAQLNFHIPNTRRFADVGVPSQKLDVEFDGDYWHKDLEKDKARDNEILAAGWGIVHVRQHNLDDLIEAFGLTLSEIMA